LEGAALPHTKAKKARGSKQAVTVKIEKTKGTPVKTTQGPTAPDAPPTTKVTTHPPRRYATATEMASKQREISVSEFFAKNRHLLGFDNPRKALLTTVKEAVDNALDACEEAGILPEVEVRIDVAKIDGQPTVTPAQADRFIVTVTDNGPGIPRKNIGNVFGKLLFGSKFHRLRMSRGQQGIGISAAAMYGQLTTGKPTRVVSKIKGQSKAHCMEFSIDTKKNQPAVHDTDDIVWDRQQGTQCSIELVGKYLKGKLSVDEYLELTAVANPHAQLTYVAPDGSRRVFPRGIDQLPHPPREIKPHPLGIELGMLLKMAQDTKSHWLSGFLSSDFSRVSANLAQQVCEKAGLSPKMRPRDCVGQDAEKLYRAIQQTKFMNPPTDCLSPIGEEAIKNGLFKSIKADFYVATTRPPAVYRGNPFTIEAAIAFGKGDGGASLAVEAETAASENGDPQPKAEGEDDDKEIETARLIRFANRVPLLYQQTACATFKAAVATKWKNYGIKGSRGALPEGPMTIFVHMASVWVPFTSEAKEAVAEYDEIIKEIKLALQECGRKLGIWVRKRQHAKSEFERRNAFQRYIAEVAEACGRLKDGKLDVEKLKKQLARTAEEITGGEETDRLLNLNKDEDEQELSDAIIRTADGAIQGSVSQLALQAAGERPTAAAG
jgi:DNA topoisomerase-6 subunit B